MRNEQAGEPNEEVLDQAPPWVAEEVGDDMARRLGRVMKELSIDEHLLRFFNHDSWEMVGVQDPILRCRLLRRQQHQKATTAAVKNRDSDNVKAAQKKAKEEKKAAAVAKAKVLAEAAALAAAAAEQAARDAEASDDEEEKGKQEKGAILARAQLLDPVLISPPV